MTNARSQFIGAATFSLFESMVLDFSFWKLDDMKRFVSDKTKRKREKDRGLKPFIQSHTLCQSKS